MATISRGLQIFKLTHYVWETANTPSLNPPTLIPLTNGTVFLDWLPTGGNTYSIYRYTSPILSLNSSVTYCGTTDDTYFYEYNRPNGTYYYAVQATNRWGNSSLSVSRGITVVKFTPHAPTLSYNGPNYSLNGYIALKWNSVAHADTYSVYRYNAPITVMNSSLTFRSKSASLQFEETLTVDGRYCYAVIATNETGNSSVSNCLTITVDIPPTLNPVLNNDGGSVSQDGIIKLSWGAIPNSNNYTVYRYTKSITTINGSLIFRGTYTGLNFQESMGWDGTYYYVVCTSENSRISNNVVVIVDHDSPAVPVLVNFDLGYSRNGSISLSWGAIPLADNYTVYRSKANIIALDANAVAVVTTSGLTFQETYLEDGVYYVVVARNETGSSALSNCIFIFTDVVPYQDRDGDGLLDWDEIYEYGTDPLNPDTDDDGLPDGWEEQYQTDPLVGSDTLDPDGDGLSNFEEYTAGTNPNEADSDDDGYNDKAEIEAGSDPNDPTSVPKKPLWDEIVHSGFFVPVVGAIVSFGVGEGLAIMKKKRANKKASTKMDVDRVFTDTAGKDAGGNEGGDSSWKDKDGDSGWKDDTSSNDWLNDVK